MIRFITIRVLRLHKTIWSVFKFFFQFQLCDIICTLCLVVDEFQLCNIICIQIFLRVSALRYNLYSHFSVIISQCRWWLGRRWCRGRLFLSFKFQLCNYSSRAWTSSRWMQTLKRKYFTKNQNHFKGCYYENAHFKATFTS